MKYPLEKIGNCGAIVSGSTPKTANNKYWDGEVLWATPKDLSSLKGIYINDTNDKITQEGMDSCSTHLLPANSVLLSSRAPIGLLAINSVPMCTNQGFKSIIPKKDILESVYLYYYLKTKKQYLNSIGNGATFKEISKETFSKVLIPLPPLHDQIRIATVLTRAEKLIAKRKESIKALDELLKSTFLTMFGDPVRNEKGWERKTVIDYAECIVPGRDKPKSFTGSTPWVTTDDLVHLGFTSKSKSNIGLSELEIIEVRSRVIPAGSVIITCVGDLGIATIANDNMVVNQQLHAFQFSDAVDNIYAMHAISFQKNFMYKRATKTTVPYMNKTVCNSIPLMCPPPPLQKQFSKIAKKTELLKSRYTQSLASLENLYSSLSQRAFKGELDMSRISIDKNVACTELNEIIKHNR